jgi:glycosyltransferase involved in cell wall biosynthesis
MKKPVRIFYEVTADHDNVNAQSLNARGIALRLNPQSFCSSFLVSKNPDPALRGQSHIRLIPLPPRLKGLFGKLCLLLLTQDILVYPNPYFHTPLWSRFFPRIGRKKKIVFPLEASLGFLKEENPQAYRDLCRILRESDLVVPISDYTRRALKDELGIQAPMVIPLGIDTSFFHPADRQPSRDVRVLFAGRLIARKGLGEVVEAARRFPRVTFRVVGSAYGKEDGAFARKVQGQVRDEGLRNVEFLGALSQERLRQVFWESDILLHPSRVEGIPRVTLEAGATGIPSIVFDDYRTPSVVDGLTGFQVKRVEEMMDRLGLLAEDGDLRGKMGRAAVEHVKAFDWRVLAKQWEKAFTEILQE